MAKLTLDDLANIIGNESSAIGTINDNSDLIEIALENTLSRDGTAPNEMEADLDMNENDILNAGIVDTARFFLDGVEVVVDDLALLGDVAPDDAEYITTAAHAELLNEKVAQTGTEVTINTATPGQISWQFGSAVSAYMKTLLDDPDLATLTATLGLGTAAFQNTGTAGANIPFLNGVNSWSQTNTYTASIGIDATGAGATTIRITGTNSGTAALRPVLSLRRGAGGAVATSSGDQLASIDIAGTDGTAYQTSSQFVWVADGLWSGANRGTDLQIFLNANGSISRLQRWTFKGDGSLQMRNAGGTQEDTIASNGAFKLRGFTVAALPAATLGHMITCTDLDGEATGGQLNGDGTNWRRVRESGYATRATDAAFTLTTLSNAIDQFHTGTLTANRVVTLSTTRAYKGARFNIIRTGPGAFYLDIGGIARLYQNQWCEVVYDGSAWVLKKFGQLSTDGKRESLIIAASDETTALTTGAAKVTFRMPYAMILTDVRASVTTAPTGGTLLTVDVNETGTTILSTKLTFDASEKTTTTAATPRVISDILLADDAEITVDIDAVGSTIAGAGLKVYLIGTRVG